MAVFSILWSYLHHLYGLFFHFVKWFRLVLYLAKIDCFEIETSDGAVVHGTIIDSASYNVGGHGPLGGTGNVWYLLPLCKLNAGRYVKVVEDVEGLRYRFLSRVHLGCCGLEKGSAYKPRRRRHVAWYAEHATTSAKGFERQNAHLALADGASKQVDIVVEVC